MSLEIEDTVVTKDLNNCFRKKTKLSGKLFSIDNLLNNTSRKIDSQNANETGMSTLGSSDNEEDCDEEDDVNGKDEVDFCKSKGDQNVLKYYNYYPHTNYIYNISLYNYITPPLLGY